MISHPSADAITENDPALRHYRTRLAQGVLYAFFVLLAVWLVVNIVNSAILSIWTIRTLTINLVIILVLGSLGTLTFRFLKQGKVVLVAYLLCTLFFVLTLTGTLLFPRNIYLISGGYLVAIVVAGAILNDRSGYLFAALSLLAVSIAWFRAHLLLRASEASFDILTGVMYLAGQAILTFGFAAMLKSISQHISQTIERLSSQTEQLTHLALTDPLTGLSNRRHILDQMQREFLRARRYRRPLSLAYIDMDGFKTINDRFGHIFGDEILSGAALAMRGVLRSTDLLARIGGDEFAILLPETTISGSLGVIQKLRKALTAYCRQIGHSIPEITFSAGVAQLREDDDSSEVLIARADDAQRRAKDAGTGQTRTQLEIDQLPLFDTSGRPSRRS
ncbi:MAG: diguanylate cyclase [Anaerolineales bacterium]|nr:diguanylate cyclase [Anaerolineales bacterium]